MRRALAKHETIRTTEEVADENRARERMVVIREFAADKSAAAARRALWN